MKDRDRPPSIIRAIKGPITLITVGVLFGVWPARRAAKMDVLRAITAE